MQKNGPLALVFHSLVVAFVLAPLLIICLVAFTPENTLSLPTTGISMRWFKAVFVHPDFVAVLLEQHLAGNPVGDAVRGARRSRGTGHRRLDFAGRDALNALFLSPLIIPHLVLGVAFLRLFALMGATGSFAWLVVTHIVIVTPYVLRLVLAALSGLDRSAEQAAMTLGASNWTTFRRVTAPMILPGITGGWLLAFINSFDELTMSIFVTAPATVTLPVRMYMYATEIHRSDDGCGLGLDDRADGSCHAGARPRIRTRQDPRWSTRADAHGHPQTPRQT